jgi:Ca2+-transporting ATPase
MLLIIAPMLLGFVSNYPLPLPFLPIQILWINLVTDGFPALSLGVEPAEKDIMKRKPRDTKESILHSSLPFILFTSFLGFLVTICIFLWELSSGLQMGLEPKYVEHKARTMAFTTTIFFQMFFVLNCKSEKKSVFSTNILSNKKLIISVIFSFILQFFVIYVPLLQNVFETVPLGIFDLTKIFLLSSLGLFVFPEIFIRKSIRSIDYVK